MSLSLYCLSHIYTIMAMQNRYAALFAAMLFLAAMGAYFRLGGGYSFSANSGENDSLRASTEATVKSLKEGIGRGRKVDAEVWKEAVDPGSGRTYYYNPKTQSTSWMLPNAAPPPPPPPPSPPPPPPSSLLPPPPLDARTDHAAANIRAPPVVPSPGGNMKEKKGGAVSAGGSAALPTVALPGNLATPLTVLSGATTGKLKMTQHGATSVSTWILDNMMGGFKFRGSFVEFGCADGRTGSNSYPFEQLGWEGLCIEPHIPAFKKAQKIRKYTENAIITPKAEEFTYWTGGPSCEQGSGIWEFYSPEYKKLLTECDERGDIISKDKVMGQPLETLLEKYGMKTVTWISIDCEGCEGPFIKSFDFTKYVVGQQHASSEYCCLLLMSESKSNTFDLE